MQTEQQDPETAVNLWKAAREDYRGAAKSFQQQHNLSGVIFATGNAALLTAQLGDNERAFKARARSCLVHGDSVRCMAPRTWHTVFISSGSITVLMRMLPGMLPGTRATHSARIIPPVR